MNDVEQQIEEFRQERYKAIHEAEKRCGIDHPDVVEMRRAADLAISAYAQALISFDEPDSDKAKAKDGNWWTWMTKLLGFSK